MADKLSFFTADSDFSSDSDDSEQTEIKSQTNSEEKKSTEILNSLPSPLEAISEAKRPDFTTKHIHVGIDWQEHKKEFEELPPREFRPWEHALPTVDSSVQSKSGNTTIRIAQQIPLSHVVDTSKPEKKGRPISQVNAAVEWSKMYDDGEAPQLKRLRPEQIGGEVGFMFTNTEADKRAYKKSFQTKEKRKRDIGQSNRDKHFVEEEKRILKQTYDA